jgi:hypothetical protein
MTMLAKLAGKLSFAQLLGQAAASEDDDKKKDDKDSKAKADEDDEEKKKEEDEDKAKKSKKAEEDEEKEEAKSAAFSAGASAERERCMRIVAHGVATGSVRQACVLATDTDMTAEAAIAAIDASSDDSKAASRGGLASRMASEKTPVVSPEAQAPAAGSVEARVAAASAAIAKAQGKTA